MTILKVQKLNEYVSVASLLRSTLCKLLCLFHWLPVNAQDLDLTGKTVQFTIPFRSDGGAGVWAKFNSAYLSKHLPGNPAVQVTSIAGGGSTRGANIYSVTAKPDGLNLLGTSASTQFAYLLGDSRVKYDYERWQVLMVYPTGGIVYVSPKLGISNAKELAKLKTQRLVFGSIGATSLDIVALLCFDLLDLNVRSIFGIVSRGAAQLAFEREETNIDFQTSAAYLKNIAPLVNKGSAVPLFSFGTLDDKGGLIRDPGFPELPHIGEVYEHIHGSPPSGIKWESWFALFSAAYGAQKLLVVPKETPSYIVEAYHSALNNMMLDEDYIARKDEALGPYEQVTGEAAQRLYALATGVPQKHKEWIRSWLRDVYKLNI